MIPRYAPTYKYNDLLHYLIECFKGNVKYNLRSRLATLFNVKHVFLLNSARVALYTMLKAYNRPGGVLMPAYNCIVVPEAVHHAGYQPVFVDIDYPSLSMNAETIKKTISSEISVILATHLFGLPCEVDEITNISKKYNVLIVEDAAPALGAKFRGNYVTTFGDAAFISFHSTKVISGEAGGALLINNDELAFKVDCLLKSEFSPEDSWPLFTKAFARKVATAAMVYPVTQLVYRTLFDELMYEIIAPKTEISSQYSKLCSEFSQFLILRQLDRLEGNLIQRRKLSEIYLEGLAGFSGIELPVIPAHCSPAWIQFPIKVDNKMAFYKHMQHNAVDLSWSYRYSCAESYGLNGFPNTHKAANTVLGLPTYPSLLDKDAKYICKVAWKYQR